MPALKSKEGVFQCERKRSRGESRERNVTDSIDAQRHCA